MRVEARVHENWPESSEGFRARSLSHSEGGSLEDLEPGTLAAAVGGEGERRMDRAWREML